MIHRAILGSVERMIAILTENYGGKWPFWLSPRQVIVIPVANAYDGYATKVQQALHSVGLYAETECSGLTLNKKIRNAEIAQWNFIFVVGEAEMTTESVNARSRDDPNTKSKGEVVPLDKIISQLLVLKKSRASSQNLV